MRFALPFRLPSSHNAQMLCAALMLMALAVIISSFHRKPRPWRTAEVPIAFWAWRHETPSELDVKQAIECDQARAIFLRGGQIDYQDGKLRRIRAVNGPLPKGIDLHLVYNGTHSLLSRLENIDEQQLASSLAAVFHEDCDRATQEHARVVGLQIDIDVPTRLLTKYEKLLAELHRQLPAEKRLSITGLPTWMKSAELSRVLAQVDFWVPQFYGAEIPARSDQMIPISSPKSIAEFVDSAREINKPYYAGLAAFSWALLYNSSGSLIDLRGDMDPATIAADPNLELIDQRPFDNSAREGSEWRYVYKTRADGVTDRLAMHAGDLLVLDIPSTESLRASARIVRERAGEKLQGICVFRLPAQDDPAALHTNQIATALADWDPVCDLRIRLQPGDKQKHAWILEVENAGTAGAVNGLTIDLPVRDGTIASVIPGSDESAESMCGLNGKSTPAFEPCSERRANLIRIHTTGLRPGQILRTKLELTAPPAPSVSIPVEIQTDTGARYHYQTEVIAQDGVKQ
jgi:hypothetical protein